MNASSIRSTVLVVAALFAASCQNAPESSAPNALSSGSEDRAADRGQQAVVAQSAADQGKAAQKQASEATTSGNAKASASNATARSTSQPRKTTESPSADGMLWRGHAFPTGDENTSAVLLRKGFPTEVQLNTQFEYELEVSNLTDHNLEDVIVRERLPAHLVVKSTVPAAQSQDDGVAQWTFAKLGPKEKRTIRISGSANKSDPLNSCATVTYDSRVCSSIAVVQPSIQLTKIAPQEAMICDEIPVKYVVTNTGTGTARRITITEDLPENIVAVNKRPVSFDVDSLAAGASREFTVKLRATKTGKFVGAGLAKAGGDLKADSKSTTTTVRAPVLEVKTAAPEQVFLGRDISQEITVTNVGDAVAKDAVLEQSVPRGAKFMNATSGGQLSGSKVFWKLGELSPKATRTVGVTFSAQRPVSLSSDIVAVAACAEPARAVAKTKLVGIPAILLEVIDLQDPIAVGDNVTYEIKVTNQGTAPGTGIAIECTLEDGMEYVSSSGVTQGNAAADKLTFVPLASLEPKGKASWRVVVKATAENDARFRVRMTSDQTKRPVEETEATNFYK